MAVSNNNDQKIFDVIVLGVGAMGAAACYYLSARGVSVLGLEQFTIPHEAGSHSGQSRLIRKAYFEHPGYVPLLEKAYENWRHLENISNTQVYYETGLFYFGPPGHALITGAQASAGKFNIELQRISQSQMLAEYPQLDIPAGYEKLREPAAGFITPEKAIVLYTQHARKNGALIKTNTRVSHWRRNQNGVEVHTSSGIYRSKKLVITAGPWAGKLIKDLSPILKVTRQVMAWITVSEAARFKLGNFPCWMLADEAMPGIFYGFPILDTEKFGGPPGLKLAHHFPGEIADPDLPDREPGKKDEESLLYMLEKYFPGVYLSTQVMKTCRYTNSPDENFIIDFLPGHHEDVVIAAGFSGHGFKFASVVGEMISDLAMNGKTLMPVDFLKINRFANNSL